MTDPAVLGALVGLALGVIDFYVIGLIMGQVARQRPSERLGASTALNIARVSQLIFFPVAGWFFGPMIAG